MKRQAFDQADVLSYQAASGFAVSCAKAGNYQPLAMLLRYADEPLTIEERETLAQILTGELRPKRGRGRQDDPMTLQKYFERWAVYTAFSESGYETNNAKIEAAIMLSVTKPTIINAIKYATSDGANIGAARIAKKIALGWARWAVSKYLNPPGNQIRFDLP